MGKGILGLANTVAWVAGIVLAKGFWMTTLAVFFPLYGWYKLVQFGLVHAGVI
jgi:hypothetical protein